MTETIDREPKSAAPSKFRPGQVALRDTWFPMIQTCRLGKRPERLVLHGAPVVFWRDGSLIRATEDLPGTPPHMRRCGEMTQGAGEYIISERYGYVWVWYGDPKTASVDLIPAIPHIPVEGMPKWFCRTAVMDCSHELLVENLLDLTHADFLHSKLTGDPLSDDDIIEVESTSETVTMVRTAHGRPMPVMQKAFAGGATQQNIRLAVIAYVRNGLCLLHGDFNPGISSRMMQPSTPETSTRTRTLVTFNPQHTTRAGRLLFPTVTHMVARQDNWAVRKQNGQYIDGDDGARDLSSRFDKAGLRYRKVYSELVSRQRAGDYSYLPDGDPARDVTEELGLNIRA